MKKTLLTLVAAAALSLAGNATVKYTVTPVGEKPVSTGQNRVVSMAEILVNEDFSGLESGAVDAPDYDKSLSKGSSEEINPALTHGNQWTGWKCYPAGGAIALRTFDPSDAGYVATPKMDLSGSLHISFMAKCLRVEWEDENGDILHWGGSTLSVALANDGENVFSTSENQDKLDEGKYANKLISDYRLYYDQGWYQVDIELDNYSAYNDAVVEFYSSDGLIIDDVKVTSSMDKFIAAPVITGIDKVKEDSFTVHFQPVRGSFNYYAYLYELKGYDAEGEPILQTLLDPDTMAALEMYGMSLEDYIEGMGGADSPYIYFGTVESKDPKEFTFYGLDPEKDYYFAISSHHVQLFSERNPMAADVIAAPQVAAPSDVTESSFTANWGKIAKADNYDVTLYGVNKVEEDTDDYIIFEENFDNVSAYASGNDINNPDKVDKDSGLTIDDLTSTPGWNTKLNHVLLVEGKLGLDDYNYLLEGPKVYVAGADEVSVSLCVESTVENFPLYFNIGGVRYQIPVKGQMVEDTFVFPTNGLDETEFWIAADEAPIFINYIIMSQPLKKGDLTYAYLGKQTTENGNNSVSFTGLDDNFAMYGYSVNAFRGKENSAASDRMVVDLKSGESYVDMKASGVAGVAGEIREVARYSLDGRSLTRPEKGVNIVRYSDGKVRKVMVK